MPNTPADGARHSTRALLVDLWTMIFTCDAGTPVAAIVAITRHVPDGMSLGRRPLELVGEGLPPRLGFTAAGIGPRFHIVVNRVNGGNLVSGPTDGRRLLLCGM